MKQLGFVGILILIVLSFAAGYWPQHKKLTDVQTELAGTSTQLSNAQSAIRLFQLENQLVTLVQAAGNKNYAEASTLSTKFFDGVRDELAQTPQPELKTSLQSLLNQRDAVTAALAKGDPSAHDQLVQLLTTLSQRVKENNSGSPPKS